MTWLTGEFGRCSKCGRLSEKTERVEFESYKKGKGYEIIGTKSGYHCFHCGEDVKIRESTMWEFIRDGFVG